MCSLLSLRTGSAGANIRFFPDDGRLSVSWELGRREWFNEAETSSPLAGFGLTPSSSGRTTPFAWIAPDRIASRASLLPPADAQLDVERTILIIDTFQPIRTTSHCWCYQEETEQTEDRVRLRGLRCLLFTPPGVRMPHRVGPSGHPLRPPSEPCVKVSLHTAQAFQWTHLRRECPGWASSPRRARA